MNVKEMTDVELKEAMSKAMAYRLFSGLPSPAALVIREEQLRRSGDKMVSWRERFPGYKPD